MVDKIYCRVHYFHVYHSLIFCNDNCMLKSWQHIPAQKSRGLPDRPLVAGAASDDVSPLPQQSQIQIHRGIHHGSTTEGTVDSATGTIRSLPQSPPREQRLTQAGQSPLYNPGDRQLMHGHPQSPLRSIHSQDVMNSFSSPSIVQQSYYASLDHHQTQWSVPQQSQVSSLASSRGSSPHRHGSLGRHSPYGSPHRTTHQSSLRYVRAAPQSPRYDERYSFQPIGLNRQALLDSSQGSNSQTQSPFMHFTQRGNVSQQYHPDLSNQFVPPLQTMMPHDETIQPLRYSTVDQILISTPLNDTTSTVQSRSLAVFSPAISEDYSSVSETQENPQPQNLRGDPFRSAKVKTELCRFFNSSKGCAFGDKCNYAHGQNELKFNKLADLEEAGLVDLEVFRCHVCFTWVATGTW